jgi:hypothetical protein
MDKELIDEALPSYQESVPRSSRGLLQRLEISRSQHLQHIISTLVLPILTSRASRGLSKSTIGLIPKEVVSVSSELPPLCCEPDEILTE